MKSSINGVRLLSLALSIAYTTAISSSCGCDQKLPSDIQPGESVNFTLPSSSGVTPRKYRLHLPSSYAVGTEVPLILSFHGRGKDGKFQEELSQFSNESYGFEGIVAYPEGVPNSKNTQQYQGDPDAPTNISDVKFTLELLDHIESIFCIDTSRIYASGKSNGGGFTSLLACDSDATQRIAAFAPVSAALYLNDDGKLPECKPSRTPIPIMEFHGFADKTINYAGGVNTRGDSYTANIPEYIYDWAERDGFSSDADISTLCEGKKLVTRYSWDDTVVHYNYTNVGHDWPSLFLNGDTGDKTSLLTCEEAEATPIILEWFKKWNL